MKKGQQIRLMGTDARYTVERIGVITPKLVATECLGPGEIGFITASIKEVADTRVGDTITEDRRPTAEALPGFKPAQPVVFCGLFPGRCGRFRGSARRHGQAQAQRRLVLVRDGNLGSARLRLPLRLPRASAPGDHPGAAGTRIQSRPDRHGPRWSTG
jgi:hypothetical protein